MDGNPYNFCSPFLRAMMGVDPNMGREILGHKILEMLISIAGA